MDTLIAVVQAASLIIAGASILANFTKTETDNKVLAAISKVINILAVNIKK